jgi:uncharacterized protein YecE (DUF72 family)
VLAQFPFSFHNTTENRGRLEGLLARLPTFPIAVEFRHASWNAEQARELLARRGAAFVNIDQPDLDGNLPATDLVTAPLAYFRFHGRNAPKWFGPDTSNEQRYNYLYSEEELAPWVERIRGAVPSIAALTGEGTKGSIYAILNNHFRGQAVANAIELNSALTGAKPEIPSTLADAYPRLARIAPTRAVPVQRPLFGS